MNQKMPKTKIINEEIKELLEDHKGSKYWDKPIRPRRRKEEGFYKNQEKEYDSKIAFGICELEDYETEIKISKGKATIKILEPIYYELSESSDTEEEIEICKGTSIAEDLKVYKWLSDAGQYLKAKGFSERKKLFEKIAKQTTENTIVVMSKGSLEYILNHDG